MTAGDKGIQLQVVVSALGYLIQQGSTCKLLAWPGKDVWPPKPPVLTLAPLTVSSDGTTATYVTTGNDFTQGGEWSVQVEITPPTGGLPKTTPPGSFYVNHNGATGQ